MKNLFNTNDAAEIHYRIDKLTPDSQKLWGKMNAGQMLAHCTAALKAANGETHPPRIFIGRILTPFIKNNYYNEAPFPKNTPTDKTFVMNGAHDFEKEKQLLKAAIEKFYNNGEGGVTKHPHSFFGKLTPAQWSRGMYKHLDHHLRQFGV